MRGVWFKRKIHHIVDMPWFFPCCIVIYFTAYLSGNIFIYFCNIVNLIFKDSLKVFMTVFMDWSWVHLYVALKKLYVFDWMIYCMWLWSIRFFPLSVMKRPAFTLFTAYFWYKWKGTNLKFLHKTVTGLTDFVSKFLSMLPWSVLKEERFSKNGYMPFSYFDYTYNKKLLFVLKICLFHMKISHIINQNHCSILKHFHYLKPVIVPFTFF